MATTDQLNTALGLTAPTATDRRAALRALTLAQIAQLCNGSQETYTEIRGLIQPFEWDLESDGVDIFPMWGKGERLASIHIGRKGYDAAWAVAWQTLNEFFSICYPEQLSDLPAIWSFEKDTDTTIGRFEDTLVVRGGDKYSAMRGLVDYERYLQEEGLIGPASAYEGSTLFEVSNG